MGAKDEVINMENEFMEELAHEAWLEAFEYSRTTEGRCYQVGQQQERQNLPHEEDEVNHSEI